MSNSIQDIPDDYDNHLIVLPDQNEKTLSSIAHLSGLAGSIVPLANIIVPLVLYSTKKDESDYIATHSKEALNFQISIFLIYLMCIPLIFIIVGIFAIIAVAIFSVVVNIIAGIKAYNGEDYRYPLNFRFIK